MRSWLVSLILLSGCVAAEDPGAESAESEARGGKPRAVCGDGICDARRESCSICAADCGQCPPPAPDAGVSAIDAGSIDAGSSGGGGGGGGGIDCHNAASWPAAWASYEDEVLTLVNQARAGGAICGGTSYPPVGPLVMDSALREAARCHSLDMATQNYFSHTSLDGRSPWTRIAAAGYTGSATGENIAAGYGSPSAAVAGWMASSGHCSNIMSGGSNETGIGYAYDSRGTYGAYWTETFGHR